MNSKELTIGYSDDGPTLNLPYALELGFRSTIQIPIDRYMPRTVENTKRELRASCPLGEMVCQAAVHMDQFNDEVTYAIATCTVEGACPMGNNPPGGSGDFEPRTPPTPAGALMAEEDLPTPS